MLSFFLLGIRLSSLRGSHYIDKGIKFGDLVLSVVERYLIYRRVLFERFHCIYNAAVQYSTCSCHTLKPKHFDKKP